MPEFNPKVKTTYVLDYNELDDLVNKYLKPVDTFESVPNYYWNNDTNISAEAYTVFPYKWDEEDVDKWIKGERRQAPGIHAVLTALVQCDVLPAGDYMIEVCW